MCIVLLEHTFLLSAYSMERIPFVIVYKKKSTSMRRIATPYKRRRGYVIRKREPIIVTVCLGDDRSECTTQNSWRLDLAKRVTRRIARVGWKNLDAVLFPGGFLQIGPHLRPHPIDVRIFRVDRSGITKRLRSCARFLTDSPGVKFVVGIDGRKYSNGDSGDQLCVGVSESGIEGIASKIFPVNRAERGRKPESKSLVLEYADFGSSHRLINLANGHRALLCACYDMFGVAEGGSKPGRRGKAIRRIAKGETEVKGRAAISKAKAECLTRWLELMKREAPSVALAAIHRFAGHSTAYWQKHGIASASAALGGGYALGAAHFEGGLPKHSGSSPLAAAQVEKSHLRQGVHRKQNAWIPKDGFTFESQGVEVLVRLFDGNDV